MDWLVQLMDFVQKVGASFGEAPRWARVFWGEFFFLKLPGNLGDYESFSIHYGKTSKFGI